MGSGIGQGECRKSHPPPEFDPRKPARIESPYRLPYPGPKNYIYTRLIHFSFCVHKVVVTAIRPNFAAVVRCTQPHNRWSRLGCDQYTPPENKTFWEYFLHIISFKYFNIHDETNREYVLRNYVGIIFYTQFEIIQDSTVWNLRHVSLNLRCESDLRSSGMLRS